MNAIKICLIINFVTIQQVLNELLPIDELKCKLEDEKCMTASIKKALPYFANGIPEIGIEVLDVMNLDPIKFNISGFKFTFTNGQVKGLRNADIKSVKWDKAKQKVDVIYHINSTLTGLYTASGQILILPITGDGQMKVKFRNVMIKFTLNYILKNKEDKEYVRLTKFNYEFDIIDNASYNLTNLFNGNKELSVAMHTFLNDNWKLISTEFGTPILKAIADKLYKNCIIFFNKYPIHDISLS